MKLFLLNEDDHILDQIRRGDEGALERLYYTNERPVEAYVTRNSGSHDDAEDMLQEALVILWERVRTGRYTHTARISTFIFATVKNLWLRRLARARREVATDMGSDPSPSSDGSVLEGMIEAEEAAHVASAINKLGDPCRTLLLLYYWEELTMNEIAVQMGFANADTVKSKKYQCKKMLEKLLGGLG